LRHLIVNTIYYAGTPSEFITVGGIRYTNTSGPNGVYLHKGDAFMWDRLAQTTTTTPVSPESMGRAGIIVANIFFFMCTCQSIGILVAMFYALRERKRLRGLRSDLEGVSQASARVDEKHTVHRRRRTIYYATYTFTGTHPEFGPFRAQNSVSIAHGLYESLQVGGRVIVHYTEADPENCGLAYDVHNAVKKKPSCIIFGCVCSFVWIAGFAALPIYFVGYNLVHMQLLFAALTGLIALGAAACNTGMCFCLQALFRLGGGNMSIHYGADVEMTAQPTVVSPHAAVPVQVQPMVVQTAVAVAVPVQPVMVPQMAVAVAVPVNAVPSGLPQANATGPPSVML